MKKMMSLDSFLTEYVERNDNNQYIPVAVGRYGIRKREDIYSKELAKDYSKNKLIFKDTLTVGMGSVQMDIGVLVEQEIYSVSPAYHTYRIASIDSSYLKYCLECRNMDMFSRYVKRGSRQGKSIDLKRWLSYEIPVCSEEEQRRIVGKIDFVERLIVNLNQEIKLMDDIVKSRFVEMFGDMMQNAKKWPEQRLDSLAEIVSGITKGRKVRIADLYEVPYMAVSNVKDGYIDWTTVKTIKATQQEIDQYRLLPDDVLMTEGGDPDKLGRGAIIHKPPKDCIHQNHIYRVRPFHNVIMSVYMEQYLQQQKAKRYFLGCAKQTTGIASVNMTQLRALPVLVPPIELQKQYVCFVRQTDKSKHFDDLEVAA